MKAVPEYVSISVELYQQGVTIMEIGRRMKRDHSTIHYWLQKLGIWHKRVFKYERKVRHYTKHKITFKIAGEEVKPQVKLPKLPVLNKYDIITLEPPNQGKMYSEYLQQTNHLRTCKRNGLVQ